MGSATQRTLVMFSGGIDSTATLWHILNNPDGYGTIHVHHVHLQNIEGRWRAEAIAVKKILDYMHKHAKTSFEYSESTLRIPHLGGKFMYDVEATNILSGYMTSRDPSITKVVFGVTASDKSGNLSEAVARGKAVHNAFHKEGVDHSATVKTYPIMDITKAEAHEMLPAELAALTWSCRRPRYENGKPVECGQCRTCQTGLANLKQPKKSQKKGIA